MVGELRFSDDDTLARLVDSARAGHEAAWNALVDRLQRVVWKSVNMMTYDHEVRNDAFAATWLRLAERLDTIREPEKLPGWLATTACNEVRQILRHRGRDTVSLHDSRTNGLGDMIDTLADDTGEHAAGLLRDEQRRHVRDAFWRLDEACREIITVLVLADPPVPYDEASERLDRPIGSLGPSRRRCLDKMRTALEHQEGAGA
ncbi:MAG: sigma-70 family RNA polymerase sigma factor [Ilumatobacter sp.]|uniref:RNA polymerase sigma factor n=1 Tax=Ilumatobacter sp. TaxID=1967498 RepID=UPI00261CE692|nr:sigma-70 family RNA polymerase sigma factor [Ilumatobacter sp.]MDJ0771710.1 sigma-70 family RNA polymerase sigma factor [Ilumatobacter sp.]